jgi:DNA-directed RNA polymerase subunit L
MLSVERFAGDDIVVATYDIRHPMADEISLAIGDNGACNFPLSAELAFFKNGEWVEEVLPEFAAFADTFGHVVYPWVPTNLVFEFIHLWK